MATYSDLYEAIDERLKVENLIHDGFLNAYYKWKEKNHDLPECEKTSFIYNVEKVDGQFVIDTNIKIEKHLHF